MHVIKRLKLAAIILTFSCNLLSPIFAYPQRTELSSFDLAVRDYKSASSPQGTPLLYDAIPLFEGAIKKEPNNAQAYYYFGATLEKLNRLEEAKQMYEACFRLEPFAPLGKQSKIALYNLINKQAMDTHPYDEPHLVNKSTTAINQQVYNLQMDKLNAAQAYANYQLARGQYRAARLGFQADFANNNYFGQQYSHTSDLGLIRAYQALAYAQREATTAMANGYQAARYARESGNNLINSFNAQVKPDEPLLRALGTNLYIRNYSYTDSDEPLPPEPPVELKAVAGRLGSLVPAAKPTSGVN